MRKGFGLFAGLALMSHAPAHAEPISTTGNAFYNQCKDENSSSGLVCSVYVNGLMDGIIYSNFVCIPPEVNVGQLRDVILAYLRDHPSERHARTGDLAVVALAMAFPCARKTK
jgi:hypothetical protein